MDEDEAEAVIRGTFSQLDNWHAIEGPFVPGSGSQLMGDDDDWPSMPISQVAWMGVTASLDHLLAIRWHLDAPRGRRFVSSPLRTTPCAAARSWEPLSPCGYCRPTHRPSASSVPARS